VAADTSSSVAERIQWQRVTAHSPPAEDAGHISTGNEAVKIPHVDEECLLPVQEVESSPAHTLVGWL